MNIYVHGMALILYYIDSARDGQDVGVDYRV